MKTAYMVVVCSSRHPYRVVFLPVCVIDQTNVGNEYSADLEFSCGNQSTPPFCHWGMSPNILVCTPTYIKKTHHMWDIVNIGQMAGLKRPRKTAAQNDGGSSRFGQLPHDVVADSVIHFFEGEEKDSLASMNPQLYRAVHGRSRDGRRRRRTNANDDETTTTCTDRYCSKLQNLQTINDHISRFGHHECKHLSGCSLHLCALGLCHLLMAHSARVSRWYSKWNEDV